MRSLFEFLGLSTQESGEPSSGGDTATVRRIVGKLEQLPPDRARFVAAFAYLLSRVAHADLDISDEETGAMERIVRELTDMPEEQAILVVQVAKMQSRLLGHTENFQVAREFRDITGKQERLDLLRCLFAVSAADDEISGVEEQEIRKIADELALSHAEFVEARREFNDKRSVVKSMGNTAENER
ncbi:MAG: TerB family tellurite resistance protein [Thermoanaerobaculia bacterium]|nr:TerB family tellurite resistance protein [Thermoanaerobaculia bacterium]